MLKLILATFALAAIPLDIHPGIRPVADSEFGSEFNAVEANVLAVTTPAAPTGFTSARLFNTPAADPVVCVWNHSGQSISGFRVARLDPGEDPNNPVHWDNVSGDLPASTRTFIDCSASCPGLTYRYKVRAFVNTPTGRVYSAYSNIDGANP